MILYQLKCDQSSLKGSYEKLRSVLQKLRRNLSTLFLLVTVKQNESSTAFMLFKYINFRLPGFYPTGTGAPVQHGDRGREGRVDGGGGRIDGGGGSERGGDKGR